MVNTIQIRRGSGAPSGNGSAGEPGFDTTAKKLYVSDGSAQFGVVMDGLYDANTILAADSDNTPAALTVAGDSIVGRADGNIDDIAVAASRIVGRTAAGHVAGLTATEVRTLISVEENADVTDATNVADAGAVMDADFAAANEIMVGDGAGSHAQLAVADESFVGRTNGGAVDDIAVGTQQVVGRLESGHLGAINVGITTNDILQVHNDTYIGEDHFAVFDSYGIVGSEPSSAMMILGGTAIAPFSMNSQKITALLDPVDAQDAATKAYADAVASGLDLKNSVELATAAALSPAYTQSGTGVGAYLEGTADGALGDIDGVSPEVGDRILVKNGAAGSDNGIYTVTSLGGASSKYKLTRATDADQDAEVTPGMYCFVTKGSTYADQGWVLTTDGTIVIDTTALAFSQFSSASFVDTFLELTDTPAAFDNGKILRSTAAAVEFVTFATEYLEGSPTEDLATKAPTSEWAFDHNATTEAHGCGSGEALLNDGDIISGGTY